MAVTLNETPSANRLHIGIFGKTNSGKSSFINAFSGQKVSIVADIAGTTTDPVYKPMEIYPLGPCVLIDTAGFADEGELGALRMEKTRLAAQKTDAGIILFSGRDMKEELDWFRYFKEKNTPVIPVLSKADTYEQEEKSFLISQIKKETGVTPCCISSVTGEGIQEIKENLTRCIPEGYGNRMITGNLVSAGDLVLLVMPQDIQAPKGRLILPQVQTLRELLDKKCRVMSVTTDQFTGALEVLAAPPKLIITDSQVFSYVYERKPSASMLTSFPYFLQHIREIFIIMWKGRKPLILCMLIPGC